MFLYCAIDVKECPKHSNKDQDTCNIEDRLFEYTHQKFYPRQRNGTNNNLQRNSCNGLYSYFLIKFETNKRTYFQNKYAIEVVLLKHFIPKSFLTFQLFYADETL